MRILSGVEVADNIYKDIACDVYFGTETLGNRRPKLVIVTVGEDPASQRYVNKKLEKASELGIDAQQVTYPEDVSEVELTKGLDYLNNNYNVDGIILQLPLPKHLKDFDYKTAIVPEKDVDGFHPMSPYEPCTPAGVMEILNYYGINLAGMNAVVLGRSDIVGKPMARMLMDAHATVTVCHSFTRCTELHTAEADLVVSAVGKAKFLDHTYFNTVGEVVIVDVGINFDEDNKLCGDVDFEDINQWDEYDEVSITPVPRGVGAMTVAMLMKNVTQAWLKRI